MFFTSVFWDPAASASCGLGSQACASSSGNSCTPQWSRAEGSPRLVQVSEPAGTADGHSLQVRSAQGPGRKSLDALWPLARWWLSPCQVLPAWNRLALTQSRVAQKRTTQSRWLNEGRDAAQGKQPGGSLMPRAEASTVAGRQKKAQTRTAHVFLAFRLACLVFEMGLRCLRSSGP